MSHPATMPGDIRIDESKRAWARLCEEWDRVRGERAQLLAPVVRASLSRAERFALDSDDDLDSLVLLALSVVLDHSKKGDAYLVTAARNLLKNNIRDAKARKRHDPDAVFVSIDILSAGQHVYDAPIVIADLETPLDWAIAHETVEARLSKILDSRPKALADASARESVNGQLSQICESRAKPLARASARLRRLAQKR